MFAAPKLKETDHDFPPPLDYRPAKPLIGMRGMVWRWSEDRIVAKRGRMQRLLMVCGITLLSGCASSVVPAGPDTYMISTTEVGVTQGGRAKAAAYREADAWCRKHGLVMVPIAVDQHAAERFGRYGGAELTFRALRPGDPEIHRTNVEKPDFTQRVQVR
jgi:hypothetical protein